MMPLLRLYLMFSMMSIERCVATENKFIAVLRNEAWNKFVMSMEADTLPLCLLNSGRFHLLLLDVSA